MAYAKERRTHDRVDLGGRAIVFERGDAVGRYELENVSTGGAMITGQHDLRRGHLVHVLMDFELEDQPLSVTASVQRVDEADNGGVGFALRFPILSPDQEDAIHDAVLRGLVRERLCNHAPYLVFEPRRNARDEISAEITSFGLQVETATTLLEAVRALEDEEAEFAGIVIHSVSHDPAAVDVVEFFAREDKLRTIILPEPNGSLPSQVERLAKLPQVRVPRIWSRSALQRVLAN